MFLPADVAEELVPIYVKLYTMVFSKTCFNATGRKTEVPGMSVPPFVEKRRVSGDEMRLMGGIFGREWVLTGLEFPGTCTEHRMLSHQGWVARRGEQDRRSS